MESLSKIVKCNGKACLHFCSEFSSSSTMPAEMLAWEVNKFSSSAGSAAQELHLTKTRRIPPLSQPNHVLVRVETASLNRIDSLMLGGYGAKSFRLLRVAEKSLRNCFPTSLDGSLDFPLTPGRDFSGSIVLSNPEALRRHFVHGTRVLGATSPHLSSMGGGSLAEYVLCPSTFLARRPDSLDPIKAAALSYSGLTAWAALNTGGIFDPFDHNSVTFCAREHLCGPRVLVTGVTGPVGNLTSQLAKLWGASHLTVTCPPRDNIQDLKYQLNADEVIILPDSPPVHSLYDLIIDCAPPQFLNAWNSGSLNQANPFLEFPGEIFDVNRSFPLLKYLENTVDARYVSVNPPLLPLIDRFGVAGGFSMTFASLIFSNLRTISRLNGFKIKWAFFQPDGRRLQKLADLAADGRLIIPIEKVYPFNDVKEAVKKLSSRGKSGKLVVSLT